MKSHKWHSRAKPNEGGHALLSSKSGRNKNLSHIKKDQDSSPISPFLRTASKMYPGIPGHVKVFDEMTETSFVSHNLFIVGFDKWDQLFELAKAFRSMQGEGTAL
ncbi:Uncharacterized protein TCM_016798 [Theobroma cacao]|uniref:Uncharacterized protein n=1 Tax=Theobroma cacao TaxID=3641 RepID=A0A061ECC5_THECC|nr:Uncharacterized protein TCM_016798 [Theobroma cacao]